MKFSQFMATNLGRALRVIVGLILVIVGILMNNTLGYIISIIGLIPFAAGLFDWCLLAPLFNLPYKGKDIRSQASSKHQKQAKD